ncbi:MAG: hypothetical protein ACI9IV_001728 [Paracoccaceae bacterium]|mgnify:CR=1 FL=1|jgi:uncharacterized protein YigA (DUF484 family)
MKTEQGVDMKQLRDKIISEPGMILEDRDIMKALIAANERAMGANIIDLRGVAMERLEGRLDRLEDTHKSVIAAAYDNLAGTNQVHRAILALLEPVEFEHFLRNLGDEVAHILRVDTIKLVLETGDTDAGSDVRRMGKVLSVVPKGFVQDYLTSGRTTEGAPVRAVTLRQSSPQSDAIYGEDSKWVRSEALLKLDFGTGRLPGMLVFGAEDPHQFKASQGTDLLAFFLGVFERQMRRWLDAPLGPI